jgi:hypothetical protein
MSANLGPLYGFMEPSDLFAIGIKTLPKDADPW